jgi:peptidoglycan/xylan/chitin deacetylase (PgdA/CDA1 family)
MSARLRACIDAGLFQRGTSALRASRLAVLTALLCASAQVTAASAATSGPVVTLTLDDGAISQYALAFQRAFQPHGANVTYFVPTGKIGSDPSYMTWEQLSTLAANGNEIGSHTVDHVNLTSSGLTYDQKVHQVCDSRQALLQHGLDAPSFAYPEAAYDQTAEDIVRSCGYWSGRSAGGVSASGPLYGETIPPRDIYATRTWTPPTSSSSPIQLSDMQAMVDSAAVHGGAWVQIVIHRVCSQTYDSANYSRCLASWRPIELDTLNGFLDWMQNAGQPGGAPAGAVLQTVRQTIGPAPTAAPTTTMSCDGAACSAGWYRSPVSVSLSASPGPTGSTVDKTYYTTDGSTPTTSSTVYTGPFTLPATATVRFFSTDVAGDAEQVKSQTVAIDGAAPSVVMTSPKDGASIKRTSKVTVSADASDLGTGSGAPSGVATVSFYLDGTNRLNVLTTQPYQFRWSNRSAAPGSHTLTAVATDVAGNLATSAPVTIAIT